MGNLDFLKTIGPGRASMIVGVLLMLLGLTGAFMGFEIIEGMEKFALGGGIALFILGVWVAAMRENMERK